MPILEVRNLTHSYSSNKAFVNDALNNVSLSIEQGEIVGIIGHTGSGKSTLVQHLNGLLKPTSGNVLFEDGDIWENPKDIRRIRSKVGLVFQYPEYQLFEETVYADIAFGPKNMGLTDTELETRVKETCALVGVRDELLQKSPFDLSGGEKRRVAIAGVMAMKPQVIVFDEPTAGLDPQGREVVIRMIHDYRKAVNATVLIVSHSMEDMAVITDKLAVLNNGSLYMFDTVGNVFSKGGELREIGLNVPIVTRIFDALKTAGVSVPDDVFTIDRAIEVLTALKAGENGA